MAETPRPRAKSRARLCPSPFLIVRHPPSRGGDRPRRMGAPSGRRSAPSSAVAAPRRGGPDHYAERRVRSSARRLSEGPIDRLGRFCSVGRADATPVRLGSPTRVGRSVRRGHDRRDGSTVRSEVAAASRGRRGPRRREASGGRGRRRFRWPPGVPLPWAAPGGRDAARPAQPSPVPAAALPGGDRHSSPRPDRPTSPACAAQTPECLGRVGRSDGLRSRSPSRPCQTLRARDVRRAL